MKSPKTDKAAGVDLSLTERINAVDGHRIGLYKNVKKAADPVSTVVEERLRQRYPDLEVRRYQAPARNEETLQEIGEWASEETDACFTMMADCGGCTRALVRATNAIEDHATPAVGIVSEDFTVSWDVRSEDMGRSLRHVPISLPSETTDLDIIRNIITDEMVDDLEARLTDPLTAVEKGETEGESLLAE
jgi:hypothetical protein